MKKYPSIRYPGESATDGLLEPGKDIECEFDSDFKGEVRSKASKKCARVLKEEIQTL